MNTISLQDELKMNKTNQYVFVAFEIICFCMIFLFCFGAWIYKPQKVLSLHQSLSTANATVMIQPDMVEVNLPPGFSTHFNQPKINAVRMINDNPDWIVSSLSPQNIDIDLIDVFDDKQKHMLLCYLLSLHQTPTSYDIRVVNPSGRVINQRSSGLLPEGEMMWRDQIGVVDLSRDALLHITTDQPGSKAYLCDFVIYDAPGMLFWDGG